MEGNTLHFYQIIRENPQILQYFTTSVCRPDIKQSTGGSVLSSPLLSAQEILRFDGSEIIDNVSQVSSLIVINDFHKKLNISAYTHRHNKTIRVNTITASFGILCEQGKEIDITCSFLILIVWRNCPRKMGKYLK